MRNFRVLLCLCFKTSLSTKMSLICMKTNLQAELIFIWMVSPEELHGGKRQIESGLLKTHVLLPLGMYSMLTSHIVSLYIFPFMVFLYHSCPWKICIGRLYEKLTWSICLPFCRRRSFVGTQCLRCYRSVALEKSERSLTIKHHAPYFRYSPKRRNGTPTPGDKAILNWKKPTRECCNSLWKKVPKKENNNLIC